MSAALCPLALLAAGGAMFTLGMVLFLVGYAGWL